MELLTPLTAEFYPDDSGFDYEEEADGTEYLEGEDLAQYEEIIQEMVNKENSYGSVEGKTCNLMDYFHGSSFVREKVRQAEVSVKNVDGVLYGCTTLQLKEYLDTQELHELCDYITGQYSDGWGEGFEQREIPVEGGCLYVHFWQGHEPKFQQRTKLQEEHKTVLPGRKPKLKLLGHDGNIFSILADARRLLIRNGLAEQAEEMYGKVQESGDYYQALGIISEYVETEPSPSQDTDKSKKKTERGECR
ncbi:hypothetical protein [Blautia producta]|uniref:hypothetical protein n=1 Tax=Blautia producta TaxID=33035 RepID=UPI0031B62E07